MSAPAASARISAVPRFPSREECVIHHASPTAAVDCYATQFGPLVRTREALGDQWPALHNDLLALFNRYTTTDVLLPAEYLVIKGRKSKQSV